MGNREFDFLRGGVGVLWGNGVWKEKKLAIKCGKWRIEGKVGSYAICAGANPARFGRKQR